MVHAANEKSPSFYIGLATCSIIASLLIYHDLGVIAFVLLVFLAIWTFGFRDKFTNETTASAYSVFNKDGRAIVGGFTASQFENQLRGRPKNQNDDPVNGPIAESQQEKGGKGNSGTALSDAERTKKRRAAAEAAERRFGSKEE